MRNWKIESLVQLLIEVADLGARGRRTPLSVQFFKFSCSFGKHYTKQECIPVGCVSAERWPYSENWRPPPWPDPPPKIWSRPSPPKIWSRHPPPPRGQNDTRFWKYYLGQNFVSAGNNRLAPPLPPELAPLGNPGSVTGYLFGQYYCPLQSWNHHQLFYQQSYIYLKQSKTHSWKMTDHLFSDSRQCKIVRLHRVRAKLIRFKLSLRKLSVSHRDPLVFIQRRLLLDLLMKAARSKNDSNRLKEAL